MSGSELVAFRARHRGLDRQPELSWASRTEFALVTKTIGVMMFTIEQKLIYLDR
jgi:hypothetical protein